MSELYKNFDNTLFNTLDTSIRNIIRDARSKKYPVSLLENNLFGEGVTVKLGQDMMIASEPKERGYTVLTPKASILVKKKDFSTFKSNNDLQWLDKTEKMLLRATKTLFAYKVTQIRACESLSKIESVFQETSQISLNLLVELFNNLRFISLNNSNFLRDTVPEFMTFFEDSVAEIPGFEGINNDDVIQDIMLILERNSFAADLQLTTWIVDPNDPDNYGTGPGTGVIEVGMFSNFDVSTNLNTNPSNASMSLPDPYRVMFVTEADIEIAIEEAMLGTLGLLNHLTDPGAPVFDSKLIVSSGLEFLGLGSFESNINVNYIRDRLRTFYLGRPIFNPGDAIHFYIRGNKTIQEWKKERESSFDSEYLSIDETILEAERILFTNKRIDIETYKKLRVLSDNSFGMRHVFGGFITGSDESWSGGSWSLKVECVDNMEWLRWSRFLEQPTLQDPQGILEDPLTPYEIKKDATNSVTFSGGPELLDENKELIRSGFLYYDSGILNGQVATETNLFQGQYNQSGSLSGAKVLQHPHGMVYRWKQGIITATAAMTVVDPSSENLVTQRQMNQVYGLNVAQDVLNNLDVANILSILIVGQPYNIETFIQQAYAAHNISNGSSDLRETDPLSAVLSVLRRQNNHFGNFRPYRMITISNETLLQSANNVILKNKTNDKINQLRARITQLQSNKRKLKDPGGLIAGPIARGPNASILNAIDKEIENIRLGIDEQIKLLKDSGKISERDSAEQNFNLFGRSNVLPLTGELVLDHQITRAMTLIGAQRRIEDVRLNRDRNLFIVSDQYDEQTDIRPFLLSFGNSEYKLFKGNFITSYEKCEEATKTFNLEFFCNTQGHLEFRPPQWNRTPLSILERLFEISKNTRRQVVPEFLTEIFQTRTASLRREIHGYNIRIVILCLLLNRYPDRTIIPNFNIVNPVTKNKLSSALNMPRDIKDIPDGEATGKAVFKFFGVRLEGEDDSSSLDLRVRGSNTRALNIDISLSGKSGDVLYGDTETILGEFDPIFQEATGVTSNILNVAIGVSNPSPIKFANAETVNGLRENFVKVTGSDPVSDLVSNNGKFQDSDFLVSSLSYKIPESDRVNKANKYIKKLQKTISDRDNLVTILKRNYEKEKELEEVSSILSSEFLDKANPLVEGGGDRSNWESVGEFVDKVDNYIEKANNVKTNIDSIFNGDASKGSLFDHLIEDDRRNFLGPGSGKRYIIRDADIISCNFTEKPPDHNRIDVIGNAPIIGSGLSNAFEDRYFWAGATDFDLVRQYGYKHGGSIGLAAASDAETQSKPFAQLDLQLQRLQINTGGVQLVGNEYYEPGDVVYIETKQLLYYVRSVSHSYSMGDSFTTSLTLEYGHPPGTYLPSPMDIIGQQYLKDPLEGTNLTYRNSQGDDAYRALQSDSSIVFPYGVDINVENIAVLLDYRDNALRFVNMMAELSSILIGNRVVLIRGFIKRESDQEADIRKRISIIKYLLQNPVMLRKESAQGVVDIAQNIFGRSFRSGFGIQAGNKKETTPMILPNGLPVAKVPAEKIAEQIVFLGGQTDADKVLSLNPSIITKQVINGREVTLNSYRDSFPKGGPKQRTWLDIRNGEININTNPISLNPKTLIDFGGRVSYVVEIGILDIESALESQIQAENEAVAQEESIQQAAEEQGI